MPGPRAATRTLLRGEDGAGTVRRTVLPGGLRVVTETVPTVRSATFGIWARVGSRDETPALNGATHYLEHLLFKGTRRRSALDISAALDAVGGELNAFTGKEFTCYYARVLDRDLPLAIDVVSDMLTSSVLPETEITAERDVILEEIAMTDDDPSDLVHDVFDRTLLGNTPLGRPVLGTPETVNGLTRGQVTRFYRKHYTAPRLVVAAAGNLDHTAVVRRVRAAFDRAGALGRAGDQPLGPRTGCRRPAPGGSVSVLERPGEQAHLLLGAPGVPRTDERRWALNVISAALGGSTSSHLFQEIREKRGLAYAVESHTSGYADCGTFGIYAGCRPAQVGEVLRICRDQLARVAEEGLTEEEVRRVTGQLSGSTVLGLEDTGALMHRLGKSEICWGNQLSTDALLERITSVTAHETRLAASEILSRRPSLAVIGPLTSRQADRLDRAVA